MRDFAEEMRIEGKQKRSRQEMIDKVMCKPGYTWNETVGRCLAPAGRRSDSPSFPEKPNKPDPETIELPPMPDTDVPNANIAKEVSKRALKNNT